MKKYGFQERFIIQKMLMGTNLNIIEFTDKNGFRDMVSTNIMNINYVSAFKMPIRINGNKTRIICISHNYNDEFYIYPLFLDIHHYLFSSSNAKKIEGNYFLLENIFTKKILESF